MERVEWELRHWARGWLLMGCQTRMYGLCRGSGGMQRRQSPTDVETVRKKGEGRCRISGHNAPDGNPGRSGTLAVGGPTLAVKHCLQNKRDGHAP